MQHKILLLDELGERWGKTHIYHNLRTPADALKLLCINYPDFAKYLATSHEQGIAYHVTQVDEKLSYDDLLLPLGQHDLVITPVITGSGDVGKALLGVGLIVATGGIGSVLGLTKEAATLFGSTFLGSAVGTIGVHLVLSGVSNMLAPQSSSFDIDVKPGGYLGGAVSMEKGADGEQSYAYRGAANTVGIGKTIPVVYGQALVGGHLISSSIEVIDTSEPLMKTFERPGPGTCKVNGNTIKVHKRKLQTYSGLKVARAALSTQVNKYSGRVFPIVSANKNIDLDRTSKMQICNNFIITDSGATKAENMMIMIEFRGIKDRIGDIGTTLIHGYITFRVIVEDSTGDETFLNQQLTVQGLMNTTQRIRYIFGFDPVPTTDSNLKIFIQIIDKELASTTQTKMIINRIGYNFLETT